MTMTPSTDSDRIDAWVWRISAVVILGSIMSILDTTIVNVASTPCRRELHSTIDNIQWVATGYLLALAAVIPVTGWAARRFGAKPIYLTSLVLFTLGSALCGLATSTTELIFFRVLQGVGGGMLLPVGQLMMAQAAGPKRMGRVMSVVAVPAMLAPILGPTIGGLILDNASWRWIFYVNVPIGIIAVIAATRILPKVERQPTEALDYKRPGAAGHRPAPHHIRPGRGGDNGQLHRAQGGRAAHHRNRPGGDVRGLRAARQAPAAQPAPVRPPDVLVGLDRDVLHRRRPVRRDDPAAALLADDSPRWTLWSPAC